MEATLNIPQLARVPQCAYPAYAALAAAGCGSSLACICANEEFFLTLQGTVSAGGCTPPDISASLSSTRSICIEAVPWLNRNRGPEVVGAITVMSIIATIAVILRLMARRVSRLGLGIDDWLIISALIWAWGISITQYFAVHNGFGRHVLMLDVGQLVGFTKAYVATTIIFGVATTLLKLSFLFFYRRIFSVRRYRVISNILGVIVVVYFIAFECMQFLTCRPFSYFWDKSIKGHCVNANHMAYYGTFPPDILTNIAILILPIPYLWSLQMQRAKKIAIAGIFVLGSFTVFGSIIRIPFIMELHAQDVSYTIVNAGIWLNVECNIGILSACLPVLRPLFGTTFSSKIRSRFSKTRSASRYYGPGSGSQRLPDTDKEGKLGGSKGEQHRSWYNNTAIGGVASKAGDDVSDGSEENMVPMGRIAVRHSVAWDEEEGGIKGVGGGR